jgi:hypothetical protein
MRVDGALATKKKLIFFSVANDQNGRMINQLRRDSVRKKKRFFYRRVVGIEMLLYFCTHKNGNTPRL